VEEHVTPTSTHRWLYGGVFLISMAVLTLEIALTRIFSVTMWYHLAFMVISTALLGFGASGAYLTARRAVRNEPLTGRLPIFAALTTLSIVLAFALITRLPLDPLAPLLPGLSDAERFAQTAWLIVLLLAEYILVVVPFFFAGLTLGGAFATFARRISTLYFADLIGAGLGCLLVVALLWALPGQGVVMVAAGLAALATFCFHQDAGGRRILTYAAPLAALALFSGAPLAERLFPLHIPPSKPLYQAYADPTIALVYTGHTPFARVDVMYRPGASLGAWGLSARCPAPPPPEQMFITIDAAAIAAITRFNGDLETISFVNCAPSSLAYRLGERPPQSALIIGPGGGIDVLTALYNRVPRIVGVEINPLIIALVADKALYRDFAGGIYTDYPNVEIHAAEGRNFVARTTERFDLIQFSQVDTWAAAAAGAYSLSENFLYTVEAFLDYYDHLTEDGVLTVGRWYFDPPQQAFRLVTIGTAALEARGVADPAQHFIVVRAGDTATFIMKRSPFTPSEVVRIRQLTEQLDFIILYAPDVGDADNWFVRFFRAPDRAAFFATYPLDVSPTTDDRPFFFEYYGWSNLGDFRSGKVTLLILLVQALLLASGFILWPLWRFQRHGLAMRGAGYFLSYFAALGVGFILIEVGLMQRFVLFLGHPVYATSVVLFAILFFSGVGSFLSGWLLGEGDPRALQVRVIPLLALGALVYIFLLPPLFRALIGLALEARVGIAVALLMPLGIGMGMPFPLGIRLVDRVNPALVAWAWGVNGFSSVIGSILTIMIAQSYGFSLAIGVAVVVYLLGLAAIQMVPATVVAWAPLPVTAEPTEQPVLDG
jgi:spermidine synthase